MQNDYIIITEYCLHCNVEPDFILMLGEDGLIDVQVMNSVNCFPTSQLAEVERYVHLYYDLSINVAGIDAIRHLLTKIEDLQGEIRKLKNELRFYE